MKKLKNLIININGDASAFDESDFETVRILKSIIDDIQNGYPNEDVHRNILDVNGNTCGTLYLTYQNDDLH
jgi:hypothetical protein